jgi:hypothetical protein
MRLGKEYLEHNGELIWGLAWHEVVVLLWNKVGVKPIERWSVDGTVLPFS